MATSNTPKQLDTAIPILKDQGIPNLCGAFAKGVSIQSISHTMAAAPDTFVFDDEGLSDMADTDYIVLPWNQTDVNDQSVISAKTTKQFVITGADAADVVDLLIIGRLKGQLGD